MEQKFNKFRLMSMGNVTYMELDGKTIGEGVVSVSYEHNATQERDTITGKLKQKVSPTVKLEINVDQFQFMPDGHFDEVERKFFGKEEPPTNE